MTSGAEFDDFLRDSTGREQARQEAETYRRQIDERMENELMEHQFSRLIDPDPLAERLQRSQLIYELTELLIDTSTDDVEDIDDVLFRNLQEEAISLTVRRVLIEQQAMEQAKSLILSYEAGLLGTEECDLPAYDAQKKQFIADLIIIGEFDPDGPWITFYNRVIPGAAFDANAPESEAYFLTSLEKLANRESDDQRYTAIFEGITERLKQNYLPVLEDVIIEFISSVIRAPSPADREEIIRQYCRESGLTPADAFHFHLLFDEKFPMERKGG